MRTYGILKGWTREVLDAANLQKVHIHPGPDLPNIAAPFVVWTPYGGPGEIIDGTADDRSWQARCVGRSHDYESAEDIATVIDIAVLSFFSSEVGGLWVSDFRRVGGAPSALLVDDADRTHFVCSYVASVELALPN